MLLECPVCNKKFKTLTNHLKRTHHISKEEVMRKYGITKFTSDDTFSKYSNATKERWSDPEYLNKMKSVGSEVFHKMWSDPEFVEKKKQQQSQLLKDMWKNDHYRKIFLDNIDDIWSDSDYREQMGKASSDRWKNPDYRDMMVQNNSRMMKEMWKNPEFRKNTSKFVSEFMKKLWDDDDYRNRMRELRSKQLIERWKNPEYREKVIGYLMSYPHTNMPVYVRPDGDRITMRSSWEVKVASYLDLNHINYEYEGHRFEYENLGTSHTYIPDFYLEDFNLFIEVKPSCYVNDDVVLLKRDSVISNGYNFKFVTEYDLDNLDEVFNIH